MTQQFFMPQVANINPGNQSIIPQLGNIALNVVQGYQGRQQAEQQQAAQQQNLLEEKNLKNSVDNLIRMNTALDQGLDQGQLEALLNDNIRRAQSAGGNPVDSIAALEILRTQGVDALRNRAQQATAVFKNAGLIKPTTMDESAKLSLLQQQKIELEQEKDRLSRGRINFTNIDPAKFTQESIAAAEQSGRYSDLVPIGDPAQEPAYLSELRKELRADVGKLETEAKSLTTNFNKLKNLAGEMRKGTNRSAVAQGLVALVKLGDPTSVVREEELKQALGAQSPTAAVADLLRDKGTSDGIVNAITQSIDPLNPSAVDVDGILATAEAILKPNAEAISESYNAARDRSGQLSEGGFKSIFGGSREKTFGDVASLSFGLSGSQQAPVEQPAEPQQQAIRQTFFDANGNPQEFELQGGQWVPVGAN